jgi:hypothetical protein
MRMYKDFKDLLSAFHARNVKYLIVGGYAVSFHSQPFSFRPRAARNRHHAES